MYIVSCRVWGMVLLDSACLMKYTMSSGRQSKVSMEKGRVLERV